MRRWLKRHFKRHMIRPIIYKAFSRFLTALALALLWDRFVNTQDLVPTGYAFTILGVLFLALAWISYLRLDGVRLPVLRLFPSSAKRRSFRAFSDISDHLDEEVVSFEDLPEEERNTCSLLAHALCGAIFLLSSFI